MRGGILAKLAFLLSGAIALMLLVIYVAITTPPSTLSGVTNTSAAARFNQKVEMVQSQARRSAVTKERVPVKLTLTDEEISSQASIFLKSQGSASRVRQAGFKIVDDHFLVQGMATVLGADVQFEATVYLIARDNRLVAEIGSLSVGRIPAFGPLRDAIVNHLVDVSLIDNPAQSLGVDITGVSFDKNTVIIEGQTRGQ